MILFITKRGVQISCLLSVVVFVKCSHSPHLRALGDIVSDPTILCGGEGVLSQFLVDFNSSDNLPDCRNEDFLSSLSRVNSVLYLPLPKLHQHGQATSTSNSVVVGDDIDGQQQSPSQALFIVQLVRDLIQAGERIDSGPGQAYLPINLISKILSVDVLVDLRRCLLTMLLQLNVTSTSTSSTMNADFVLKQCKNIVEESQQHLEDQHSIASALDLRVWCSFVVAEYLLGTRISAFKVVDFFCIYLIYVCFVNVFCFSF